MIYNSLVYYEILRQYLCFYHMVEDFMYLGFFFFPIKFKTFTSRLWVLTYHIERLALVLKQMLLTYGFRQLSSLGNSVCGVGADPAARLRADDKYLLEEDTFGSCC